MGAHGSKGLSLGNPEVTYMELFGGPTRLLREGQEARARAIYSFPKGVCFCTTPDNILQLLQPSQSFLSQPLHKEAKAWKVAGIKYLTTMFWNCPKPTLLGLQVLLCC